MNKSDLIAEVARRTDKPVGDVTIIVNTLLDVVTDELKAGKKVTLVNFGSFEVKEASERVGRNPRNPDEQIIIPSKTRVAFKASKKLKEKVNEEE